MNWFLIILLGYLAIGATFGVYELSSQGATTVGFSGFFSYLLGWPVYGIFNLTGGNAGGATINS